LILIFPWLLGPLASDMDATRHEALQRRRGELYRIRRANETPEEADKRRRRQREYARRRHAQITERRRQEMAQSTHNQYVIKLAS